MPVASGGWAASPFHSATQASAAVDSKVDAVDVVLFHSMFGLRSVEGEAAARLEAAGHRVTVPDLFGGATTEEGIDAGFALMRTIGWETIVERARLATESVPDNAVLMGLSMGVGVIGELWPERLRAAAVICLHSTTGIPSGVPKGTPMQVHVAIGDRFATDEDLEAVEASAARVGAEAAIYRYPHAGHLFTDATLPDFDAAAADATWTRILELLARLDATAPPFS